MSAFGDNFKFAEKHMPAVRRALGEIPSQIFFDIQTAPVKRDMEEATDLVLSPSLGDIAVRVRRKEAYERNVRWHSFDWSVRARCNGHKTEIHKLREGFAHWYFMAYSSDNDGELAAWWLLDMDVVRTNAILDMDKWQINDNGDDTAGMYIPIKDLYSYGCIVAEGGPT